MDIQPSNKGRNVMQRMSQKNGEHRNNILVYKSQHVTEFILSDNFSTCFGRHYHISVLQNLMCNTYFQLWLVIMFMSVNSSAISEV